MTAVADAPRIETLAGSASLRRVVAAEWVKVRSLRSTWWALVVAVVLTVGIGVLVAVANRQSSASAPTSPQDLASESLLGVVFAQLVTAILGVLVITGEYGTGMIRSSMTAVPRRLPVLWAKAIVYVAVVLPVTMVSSFVTFFLAQSVLSGGNAASASLSDPGVLRVVVGSSLYPTVAGLLALGIGALVRNTAAGVATTVGLYFVLPIVIVALPQSIREIGAYLPSNAGGALWGSTTFVSEPLEPWNGFTWLVTYTVVVLGVAAWTLRRRDV